MDFPTQPNSTINLVTTDTASNLSGVPANVHIETNDGNPENQSAISTTAQPVSGLSFDFGVHRTNNG